MWFLINLFLFYPPHKPRNLCLGLKYQRNKLYSWSVRSSECLGRTETEMLSSWIRSLLSLSRTQRKVGIVTIVRGSFSWAACSLLFVLSFFSLCYNARAAYLWSLLVFNTCNQQMQQEMESPRRNVGLTGCGSFCSRLLCSWWLFSVVKYCADIALLLDFLFISETFYWLNGLSCITTNI